MHGREPLLGSLPNEAGTRKKELEKSKLWYSDASNSKKESKSPLAGFLKGADL